MDKKLLERAYNILLEKLNAKKICISFYDTMQYSRRKYSCVPFLLAISHGNRHIKLRRKDTVYGYNGFDFVYVRSLSKSKPRNLAPWEVVQYIFKLLKDIDIYVEKKDSVREIVLPKGLTLEKLLVEDDLKRTEWQL